MPKKSLARRSRHESMKLQALAFTDAVRDILASDGVFNLGDDRQGDTVWEWDGLRWTRVPLAPPTNQAPVGRERERELATVR